MMPELGAWDLEKHKISLGDNFLVSGGDPYLTDIAVAAIRARIREAVGADLVIAYGDEIKADQLNDLLDTYSIFSSSKLILLRNAELMTKDKLECLERYFDSPSDQQTLVIFAEGKTDGRLSAWKKIKASCQSVVCASPRFSGEMVNWLDRSLKGIGKTMSRQARDQFINKVELDYADANNELQKLALMTGGRTQITEQDVLKSIGTTRTGTISDFFRFLGRKQLKEALALMDGMLSADWAGLQILFQINKFYLNLYSILLMKKHHISNSEIISKNLPDLYPGQRQEFVSFAQNYGLSQTEMILKKLLDTDSQFKTSMGSDSVLLTACLAEILKP